MFKPVSPVRTFAAIAFFGIALVTSACSEINPAAPSSVSDIELAPADATFGSDVDDAIQFEDQLNPCEDLARNPRTDASFCAASWRTPTLRAGSLR